MPVKVVAMSLLLACCSPVVEKQPARATSESKSGSQATAWRVDFHLSGGFAGVDRALTLSSSGNLSAEDRRRPARVTATATAAELDQIAPLVVRIKSIPDTPRGDSRCRDCLSYSLDVETDGRRFTTRLDDTTLSGSGLNELVRALTAVLNRVVPPK